MKQASAKPVLISDAASAQRTAEERWVDLFGTTPPKRPTSLIEQAVEWHERALSEGDIPPHIRRDLQVSLGQVRASRDKRIGCKALPPATTLDPKIPAQCVDLAAPPTATSAPPPSPAISLPPASSQLLVGTRLVKTHAGKTHVVEVTADGMLYEGELFSSLSAVAKAITGTHWNGLLFFGLRIRKVYDRKKRHG